MDTIKCPNCGGDLERLPDSYRDSDEWPDYECCDCGADYWESDFKPPHVGFTMDVDGTPIHILGDPDMDDETRAALEEMGRAAIQAIKDGKIGKRKRD